MKTLFAIATVASALVSMSAQAALIGDYQLNGSLADAGAGPSLTNNGGTLGATGITFGANQGPTLGGFSNFGVYTIQMAFSFDAANGYRKILDFKSRASDNGFYNLSQMLNFYPVVTSATNQFSTGVIANVVLTRDAAGLTTGYVNGTQQIQFTDSSNLAVFTSEINFLRDDFATGEREASSGFLDFIRIYDTALSAREVAGLPGGTPGTVPEPASWALMIAGFGLVGVGLRRSREQGVGARVALRV